MAKIGKIWPPLPPPVKTIFICIGYLLFGDIEQQSCGDYFSD